MNFTHIKHKLASRYTPTESAILARLLVAHYTGLSHSAILADPDREFDAAAGAEMDCAVGRLLRSEPIQYIIGRTDFYGRSFLTDSRALIPRPETEELIELVKTDFANRKRLDVLDIGTGTGCIAITLALELEGSRVRAVDVSADALALAADNAHRLAANVDFVESDVLAWGHASQQPLVDGQYDIIVSNPPYIMDSERAAMEANVLDYEPHIALFVPDADPLLFYRQIAVFALSHLTKRGRLYFEINQALGAETVDMLHSLGFTNVRLHTDINQNARMITSKK